MAAGSEEGRRWTSSTERSGCFGDGTTLHCGQLLRRPIESSGITDEQIMYTTTSSLYSSNMVSNGISTSFKGLSVHYDSYYSLLLEQRNIHPFP